MRPNAVPPRLERKWLEIFCWTLGIRSSHSGGELGARTSKRSAGNLNPFAAIVIHMNTTYLQSELSGGYCASPNAAAKRQIYPQNDR